MKRALVLSGGGARGSFQAGVWKYLSQIGWKPDIICGTSVGAINAAAIGSGIDPDTLIHLWTRYKHRRIYKLNFLQFFVYLFFRQEIKPLLDTKPLQTMILDHLDFNALNKSKIKIIIAAVNLLTGHPEFFNNKNIKIEHLLASSALPLLFPWQKINGKPYWDGGVMLNTPLLPAIDFGANEIIVVHLSPVGHKKHLTPDSVLKAGEHLFEQLISGSYQANLMDYGFKKQYSCSIIKHNFKSRPRLITLSPLKMLGFKSLLNFSRKQAEQLIDEGYHTARRQLKNTI